MKQLGTLFTIRQAAAQINVGRSKVYYLVNSEQLRCVRIGGSVRIPEAEIARYLRRIALEQHGEDITLSHTEEN